MMTMELILDGSKSLKAYSRLKIIDMQNSVDTKDDSIMNEIKIIASTCNMARFQIRKDGSFKTSNDFTTLIKRLSVFGSEVNLMTEIKKLPPKKYSIIAVCVTKNGADWMYYNMILRRIVNSDDMPKMLGKTIKENHRKISIYDTKMENLVRVLVNPEHTWIISDLHFDHDKVIQYCNRPFADVDEMNETMLENWNKTIKSNDSVFFLGDLVNGLNARSANWWLDKLNGRISFIRGNHDTGSIQSDNVIVYGGPIMADCDSTQVLLSHYPYRPKVWDGWLVHGHMHNSNSDLYPYINHKFKTANVSVEHLNYTPKLMSELLADINT